jgi:hypothetical protein
MIVNPVGVSSHLYNESIIDLIKSGKKTAFTQNKSYNIGELIVFSLENERLLCQVCCSYPLSLISNKSWCLFESFTDEFLKKNIDIYDMGYIQTHFRFLFSIEDNEINLKSNYYNEPIDVEKSSDDLWVEEEPVEVKVEETNLVVIKDDVVINKEDNLSKEELLKHIQDLKNQIEELKKPFFTKKIESIKIWFNKKFGRKSVYQLLDSNNLKGDLFKVDNIFGKGIYYRLVNDKWTHYIDFKIGRFKNSINILITFKND